jgi:hypothetical protein
MASSGHTSHLSRARIIANVQDRKTPKIPEALTEEDAHVAARNEDAQRILSKPVKAKPKKTRRRKHQRDSVAQVLLLGTIVIGGISAIIGLRYLAETFGIRWIGD